MTLSVTLNNPLEVEASFTNIGHFASICKNGEQISDTTARRIGIECVRSGHFSPVRSVLWNFTVTGMSRVASHQLVRHHVGVAINQQSNVFMADTEKEQVMPGSVKAYLSKNRANDVMLEEALNTIYEVYDDMIAHGVSSSDARYLLPQGQVTAMNIAVSPEALIHIAHERLCDHAQWEIRKIVRLMVEQVVKADPDWSEFFHPKCVYLHGCNEKLPCGFYTKYQANAGLQGGNVHKAIEDRLKTFMCEACGAILLAKDDDKYPLYEYNGWQLCLPCYRREKELDEVQDHGKVLKRAEVPGGKNE